MLVRGLKHIALGFARVRQERRGSLGHRRNPTRMPAPHTPIPLHLWPDHRYGLKGPLPLRLRNSPPQKTVKCARLRQRSSSLTQSSRTWLRDSPQPKMQDRFSLQMDTHNRTVLTEQLLPHEIVIPGRLVLGTIRRMVFGEETTTNHCFVAAQPRANPDRAAFIAMAPLPERLETR